MKKKQFESLWKRLLPNMPGYACKGSILYASPLGHVLKGFDADGSGYVRTEFRVHVFLLPLYVPTRHLHFGLGRCLRDDRGCDKWWDINDPELVEKLLQCVETQGMSFLSGAGNPTQLAKRAEQLELETQHQRLEYHRQQGLPVTPKEQTFQIRNPYTLETIAYSLIMADDYVGAQRALERLAKALDENISWQAEVMERAKQLIQKLESDPHGAKQLLAEWEQATIKNLGL